MTWPPTLKHALGRADNFSATCRCGRVTAADMFRDMRPLPAAVRAAAGADFVCDACWDTLIRERRVTHEEFYRAHQAPATLIAKAVRLDALAGGGAS